MGEARLEKRVIGWADRTWRRARVLAVLLAWFALAAALLGGPTIALATEPEPEASKDSSGAKILPGEGNASIYVRADSDKTTVISPRIRFRTALFQPQTNLDVSYMADVWTSASIDVRTAATDTVTEKRDVVSAGVSHEFDTVTIGGTYFLSREYDYLSNGAAANFAVEAFQRNSIFETRVFANFNHVGRAGDEYFKEKLATFGGWFGYTQVLTPKLLMQLAYEFQASSGYMASPYRYVAIGGFGGCNEGGGICIPEELPRLRLRSAPVIRFRGAIGRRVSLGGAYRLYTDSWRVLSHTLFLDVAAALGKALVLKAEFRSYYQSDAVFYRKTYVTAADADYYTRDRELSNLWSQRLSLALEWDKPVAQDRAVLELGALISGTFYGYRNFVGLDRVNAIEATAMVGVRY